MTIKNEQPKLSLNLFSKYHSTFIKALGEDAKKINAKIGSIIADKWIDSESYLKELEFANYVKINCDEKNYILNIKGCVICHGNEILRKEGIATACPII